MEGSREDRWEEIDRRIARMEAFLASLGMPVSPPNPILPATPPPGSSPRDAVPEAIATAGDTPLPREATRSLFGEVDPAAAPAKPTDAVPPEPSVTSEVIPPPIRYARIAPPPLPVKTVPGRGGFEQAIGLQLAGWIGAIVVVIGGAMGVKFAYDQGWLAGLPDAVKLGLYYAVGLALIGVGEYVYRKVNTIAAVGIYSAGIAALFVVSYAGNAYYQLYEQPVAFALMAGACAIGVLISLRGGLVSIAVLSILGANIAPLILRNRAVGEVPLLVYLLALQLLAIGLAHIGKGAKWWILRNVALGTLSLWMAGRLISSATAFSVPTVIFVSLYAALFHVENALAAKKQGGGRFSHPTFSFAVTAALTMALLRWSMPLNDAQRGAIVVGLSFMAFTAGAAVLSSRFAALRPLAQSWLVQGGILLFAAVPVALSGPWMFVAWALMALGYAALGVVLKRDRTGYAGVLIWLVATFILLTRLAMDWSGDSLRKVAFSVFEHALPTYFVIGLLMAAIGHAIALLVSRCATPSERRVREPSGSAARVVAVAATILVAIISVAALPSLATTGAGIVLAWACIVLAVAAVPTANTYRALAGATITLTLARWVAIDLIGDRLASSDGVSHRLIFNPTLGIGLICVGSLWAMALLLGRRAPVRAETGLQMVSAAILLGMAAMCVALSLEVEQGVARAVQSGATFVWPAEQVMHFGWTSLWAIAAAALPLIGRAMGQAGRSREEFKAVSTLLVSAVAAKFMAYDCLRFALQHREADAGVLINAQTLVAVLLLALLIIGSRTMGHRGVRNVARSAIFLLPLVAGSIEINRILGPERTLVGFSVYWGLYAIASIAVGFVLRSSVLRFAGLGLLGITLMKVVFVDLANAGTGWRILSFLGLGIILLATSVLYGRLSPKLLEKFGEPEGA